MPVSRKRKKKNGGPTANRPRPAAASTRLAWPDGPTVDDVVQSLAGLSAERERWTAHRAATATTSGDQIVAGLIAYVSAHPDADPEPELCAQLGAQLRQWRDLPIMEAPDSDALVDAVVTATTTGIRQALAADEPTAWRAPWHALIAVAGVVPASIASAVDEAVEELRQLPGGEALPALPAGPTVAGPVRWVRDAYGSRFGVIAPFASPGRPVRWYLWDVDTCAHNPMTVYAGYHDSADLALAEWRAGVGPTAAGAATLTDVDDRDLLADLLEREYDYRNGPQSQCEEHIRSTRLADVAVGSVPRRPIGTVDFLDVDTAVAGFTAWLQEHHPEVTATEGSAERVQELASSWLFGEPRELLGTCSPHRVAHAVLHLHNFYQEDFADELTALMPHWTAWLSERNGTPPELAARCRPYAVGAPHADVGTDNTRPVMDARVIE